MKLLFTIRNKIEDFYLNHPAICGYVAKFVLILVVLLILRANIGFNPILTNLIFVLVFSAVCAFVPVKPLLLFLAAYAVVQAFSLASGVGLFACMLFVIMYLLYYRYKENSGYILLLIPLLCIIRLPILIPLVLAVTAPAGSIVSVFLGYVAYYFLRYIHINAAVFQGVAENSEVNKISMVISGIFTYKEMWYTLACVVLAFFSVYYLKKINVNRSIEMALAVGSGIYMISILLFSLVYNNITSQKLAWIVIGTILSCLLAMLVCSVILPLDYNRTELLEFEDDEYKYFVRAVPKSAISREAVHVKRIYSRKQADPDRIKEDGK